MRNVILSGKSISEAAKVEVLTEHVKETWESAACLDRSIETL